MILACIKLTKIEQNTYQDNSLLLLVSSFELYRCMLESFRYLFQYKVEFFVKTETDFSAPYLKAYSVSKNGR